MSRADVKAMEAGDDPGARSRTVAGNGNGAATSPLSLQVVEDIGQIDAQVWNDLLDGCAAPTPFMRHEYLHALQLSGSAVAATGWQPVYLVLSEAGRLVGACALYLKSHSYGEYLHLCRLSELDQVRLMCKTMSRRDCRRRSTQSHEHERTEHRQDAA